MVCVLGPQLHGLVVLALVLALQALLPAAVLVLIWYAAKTATTSAAS